MNMIKKLLSIILLCSVSSAAFSFAGFLYVEVKGEILARPCTINNGKAITINFGDVYSKDIDGETYIQDINYNVECKGALNPTMKLGIIGSSALFNDELLKTSIDDLGVAFKVNKKNLAIKDKISFRYKKPPKLSAFLVKKNNADLPGRAFSASAILQVEYQ